MSADIPTPIAVTLWKDIGGKTKQEIDYTLEELIDIIKGSQKQTEKRSSSLKTRSFW